MSLAFALMAAINGSTGSSATLSFGLDGTKPRRREPSGSKILIPQGWRRKASETLSCKSTPDTPRVRECPATVPLAVAASADPASPAHTAWARGAVGPARTLRDHQPLRCRVSGHRPVLPAGRRRLATEPAALGDADLAAQDAGWQARLVGLEDGPQVRGHDRNAARATPVHAGSRRARRGSQTAGRNVRWYSAQTAEERGPDRSPTSPGTRPRQRADPSAPSGAVRALRPNGDGASAPDPQPRGAP